MNLDQYFDDVWTEEDERDLVELEYDLHLGYFKHWNCSKCKSVFIDKDEHPNVAQVPKQFKDEYRGVERQEHWLTPTEVLCSTCATGMGIPSIED